MSHFTLVVRFKAKPGKEEALQQFLTAIVPVARQSPGCLCHSLHHSRQDERVFLFFEMWTGEQAHQNHLKRPEIQQWRSQLYDYLAEPHEPSFWTCLTEM